jgi:hypothetical protein
MNDIAAVVGSKGSANVAAIGLLSNNYYVNYGGGDFSPWDEDTFNAQIGTFDTASLELFQGFTSMPSVNSCTAFAYLGSPPPVDYGLGYVTYLDAGPSLSIQGPTGTRTIDKNSNGHGYEAIVGGAADPITAFQNGLTPFYWNSAANGDGSFSITGIASGTYSVTGPGGTAVNGFTGTIDVSSAAASFVWTNASTFDNQTATPAISRSSPLDITWTGGDPQGFVDITLTGSTLEQTNPSTANPEPAVYVQCVVPASKMSFSVPTYVLQALPPGENGVPASGFVAVGPASAVTKISPAPTGLDAAYLYYRFVTGYTVQWQ